MHKLSRFESAQLSEDEEARYVEHRAHGGRFFKNAGASDQIVTRASVTARRYL